jgi:hypothetical protein
VCYNFCVKGCRLDLCDWWRGVGWCCGWGFESGGGCLPGFLATDFHDPAHSRVRSVSVSGPSKFLCCLFVGQIEPLALRLISHPIFQHPTQFLCFVRNTMDLWWERKDTVASSWDKRSDHIETSVGPVALSVFFIAHWTDRKYFF